LLSFRRKPESSIYGRLQIIWTPAFAGVTTFYELVKHEIRNKFKFDELVKSLLIRHPGGRRGPEHLETNWIPAFAGMTEKEKSEFLRVHQISNKI